MGVALLVEYYEEMPEPRVSGSQRARIARVRAALETYKKKVAERYTEGTLNRLLRSSNTQARRAAVLALGLTGTMSSNAAVAERLHDHDRVVGQLAADALWALWFRADSDENNQELQRLMRLRDRDKALAGFDALIARAPAFAEAYNQRAIVYFRKKEYQKSIADCEKVVELNPYHFAAYAGMGQAYMRLNRPRSALKAFRHALKVNPAMPEVADVVRTLENALGEEGKK